MTHDEIFWHVHRDGGKVWRVVFKETFVTTRHVFARSKEEALAWANDYCGNLGFDPYLEDDEPDVDVMRITQDAGLYPGECDVNLFETKKETQERTGEKENGKQN